MSSMTKDNNPEKKLNLNKPKIELHKNKSPFSLESEVQMINESNNENIVNSKLLNTDFKSLSKLNDHINGLIKNNVLVIFLELLKRFSTDYNIHLDELNEKYLKDETKEKEIKQNKREERNIRE